MKKLFFISLLLSGCGIAPSSHWTEEDIAQMEANRKAAAKKEECELNWFTGDYPLSWVCPDKPPENDCVKIDEFVYICGKGETADEVIDSITQDRSVSYIE